MEREEIIEGYIRYMRIAARLSDDILIRAINGLVDEDPELLNKMESLAFKNEKISPVVTGDKRECDQEGDIVEIFDDINEALPITDIEHELTESGYSEYSNAYKVIYHAIRDDLLYIDDIESDGTIYLALTDKGEALWELIHF